MVRILRPAADDEPEASPVQPWDFEYLCGCDTPPQGLDQPDFVQLTEHLGAGRLQVAHEGNERLPRELCGRLAFKASEMVPEIGKFGKVCVASHLRHPGECLPQSLSR